MLTPLSPHITSQFFEFFFDKFAKLWTKFLGYYGNGFPPRVLPFTYAMKKESLPSHILYSRTKNLQTSFPHTIPFQLCKDHHLIHLLNQYGRLLTQRLYYITLFLNYYHYPCDWHELVFQATSFITCLKQANKHQVRITNTCFSL